MHIVLCLDDKNGILFNARRLSSDLAVCKRIVAQHSGRLMMNSYSAKLFSDADVLVDDEFLKNAHAEDTCFVENLDFAKYLQDISSITIYRWNRHYPSDVKLPERLLTDWKLIENIDFAGKSHDTITEQRYMR